nr:hypothetical protein [uncultured Sphingosinicella sp.]
MAKLGGLINGLVRTVGAPLLILCGVAFHSVSAPAAPPSAVRDGAELNSSDALVLGTSNMGSVNFVKLGRDPDRPHFSGFQLRKDVKRGGVPAGRYVAGSLFLNGSLQSYALISAFHGAGGVGEIEVRPGEVVYIGHLVFDREGRSLNMRVEDRFDQIRSKLPEPFRTKLQKRLISLPSSLQFGAPIKSSI